MRIGSMSHVETVGVHPWVCDATHGMDAFFRRALAVPYSVAGARRGGCACAGGSGDITEMRHPAPERFERARQEMTQHLADLRAGGLGEHP
jgi:hypothetical protein